MNGVDDWDNNVKIDAVDRNPLNFSADMQSTAKIHESSYVSLQSIAANTEVEIQAMVELCQSPNLIGNASGTGSKYTSSSLVEYGSPHKLPLLQS